MRREAPGGCAQSDGARSPRRQVPTTGVRIVADAKVVPVQSADLSMAAGGIVVELERRRRRHGRGMGDLLIKLDDAQQRVGVAQAQANLQRAQANLDQLQAGAREQEIAQAEAALAAAQAAYDKLVNAASPGNIAAAEAGVAQAQASLQSVLEGPSEAALIAAQADLRNSEAQLRNATSAYNKIKDQNDIGMRPESLALEQATIAYEAAQAQLHDLQNGPTAADRQRRAWVRQAQAQLDTLQKLRMPVRPRLGAGGRSTRRRRSWTCCRPAHAPKPSPSPRPTWPPPRRAATGAGDAGRHRTARALWRRRRHHQHGAGRTGGLGVAGDRAGRHVQLGDRDLRPDRVRRCRHPARQPGAAYL